MDYIQETYYELLLRDEWKEKRSKILCRDRNQCQMCGCYTSQIEVHHRYYLHQNSPWNYPDSALVSLCPNCHTLVHNTCAPLVYVRRDTKYIKMNFTPCQRCNARGILKEYNHVEGGICFRCRGSRYEELITSDNRREDKFSNEPVYDIPEITLSESEKEMVFEKGKDYHLGRNGEEHNIKKALQFYLFASIQGYGRAQNNTALILNDHFKLYNQALRWYVYASLQGIFQAQLQVANMLYKGEGVSWPKKNLSAQWLKIGQKNKAIHGKEEKFRALNDLCNASDEGLKNLFKKS